MKIQLSSDQIGAAILLYLEQKKLVRPGHSVKVNFQVHVAKNEFSAIAEEVAAEDLPKGPMEIVYHKDGR